MTDQTTRPSDDPHTAECALGWAGLVASTGFYATAAIVASALDPTGARVHPVGVAWSRTNLRLLRSCTVATGLAHVAPHQPYVVMANHQSYADVWALFDALPLQLRWVMKKELRRIPVFGTACARAGYIFVQRGDSESARQSLALAAARIAAGTSVVFFPEGTRSRDGRLGRFKTGGFRLALQAGVPILPVSIQGTASLLPRGSWRYRPGVARVDVGAPILTRGRSPEALPALMEETRAAILAGLGQGETG